VPLGPVTRGANLQGVTWMPFQNITLGQVLFSSYHGLFAWSPIVVVAIIGWLVAPRADREIALACILMFAAEWIANGTLDRYFWGGMSFGGRRFVDLTVPFAKLPRKQRETLLFGAAAAAKAAKFEGIIPNLRRRYSEGTWMEQAELDAYRSLRPCPLCRGQRLKPESLSVKVKGRTIAEYVNLPIGEAVKVFDTLQLTDREALIAEHADDCC
jgi:hypothetical protein